MKIQLKLLAVIYVLVQFLACSQPVKEKIISINVKDYGAIPNDNKNDTEELQAAIDACGQKEATVLIIPAGQYLLADDRAIKLQEDVLAGKYDQDIQGPIFNKQYKYVIGLDFKGLKNLTVKAKDAELLCDGWQEPISLVKTENITINGLSIDYKRPPNNAGEVIKVGKDFIDVKFFDWCPVRDGMKFIRIMIYDNQEKLFTKIEVGGKTGRLVGLQTLRFKLGLKSNSEIKKGHIFWSINSFHFRPAILLYKAKNTELNDISIFAQPGMGIVGHLSENIFINRLKVIPKTKNRFISCNTDATHFASNYGKIELNNCDFGGQGDDAINVHNYYMTITQNEGNNRLATMPINLDLHSQKPEVPRIGDKLAIVENKTLKELGQIQVEKILSVNPNNYEVIFIYKGDFAFDKHKCKLANISALPQLIFKDCRVQAHRARSVLCKTREVLIEGNTFFGSTGTAIHIGAEGNWNEGMPSRDVIIRNNIFKNTGWSWGIDNASAIAISVDAEKRDVPGLHQRILIQGNKFVNHRLETVISIKEAEDVMIKNNTFLNIENNVLYVEYTNRVKAISNKGLNDYSSNDGDPKLPVNL